MTAPFRGSPPAEEQRTTAPSAAVGLREDENGPLSRAVFTLSQPVCARRDSNPQPSDP